MAMLRNRVVRSAPTVDLQAYNLDAESLQWLADRVGSTCPKVAALDSLAQTTLGPSERRFMDALLEAMRGGGRKVDVSINKDGAGEAQRAGFMQATLVPKTREAEQVGRVRTEVEAVLWGQEEHLEAFCQVASDHVSTSRTLPAVLAVGGERGHGKTEALQALATGLFALRGDNRKGGLHDVDLATATDASAAGMFEEDGPLSPKTLTKLVGKALVCLHGANDLAARAPQLAQRLQALILTRRDDPSYLPLVYAFDFDQTDDLSVPKTIAKALGPVGTRVVSAYAHFGELGAATMQSYCLARLPDLLKSKALDGVRVDFDNEALAVVGAALATPYMPLEELDARIYQLVLSHLDVADDGTQRCPGRVQMTLALEPEAAQAIIANLTSPFPDVTLARKLLRVAQVVGDDSADVASAASVIA
jgi:hypothetical protein